MSIERNLLISLLKVAKNGPALTELVKTESHLPSTTMEKLLRTLQSQGLVYLKQGSIELETGSRLKLAAKAVSLGADLEQVSNLLRWQEFEEITALALVNNGFTVLNNMRFKHVNKRWEIDVVACRKPLVLCVDCKHWQHSIAPSALRQIVDAQIERVSALAASLPNPSLKIDCTKWENAKFLPVILSLLPSAFKFYLKVPIVPILQVQDFLTQFPAYLQELRFVSKTFSNLTNNLQN